MSLFDQLLVAHLLGDWVLQTEWQAQHKAHSVRALASHLLVYHLLVAVVLFAQCGFQAPTAYVALAFLATTHAVLDRKRTVLWLVRALRVSTEEPPPRLLLIMADQSLHVFLLAVVATTLTGAAGS